MDPVTIALAAAMGASRMGQKGLGYKGRMQDLRARIKSLRRNRELMQGQKAALEEQASGVRGKLVGQRGLWGPNTEQQRVDRTTERARAILAAREKDLNYAIKAAKRNKRMAKYQLIGAGAEEAAGFGIGISDFGGGDPGSGGGVNTRYGYLGPR